MRDCNNPRSTAGWTWMAGLALVALLGAGCMDEGAGVLSSDAPGQEQEEPLFWSGDEARAMLVTDITGVRTTVADLERMGEDEVSRIIDEFWQAHDAEYRELMEEQDARRLERESGR